MMLTYDDHHLFHCIAGNNVRALEVTTIGPFLLDVMDGKALLLLTPYL